MANLISKSLNGCRMADLLLEEGTVLLDTADPHLAQPDILLFTDPVAAVAATSLDEVSVSLSAAERWVGQGYWAAGFVSYDAGYAFEERFRGASSSGPLVWFGIYKEPISVTRRLLAECFAGLGSTFYNARGARLGISRREYRDRIRAVRRHIEEGDVYQINFTFPYLFDFQGDTRAFYRDLRVAQPVPYGAYINCGDRTLLSLSPELFFERNDRGIVTRPMKGTASVSSGGYLDDEGPATLLRNDPKNRAENLMIVDLLRNDLSRCCEIGSVRVPELFSIHHYPSVIQMTSTVEGTLREDAGYLTIFESLFPCGSVTGAPKIRSMEIIRELEEHPRNVYCGAIGFMSPENRATFSVAIRTIAIDGAQAWMGTGSGIVWDSKPDSEFDECMLKTEFLRKTAGLRPL